MATKKIGNLDSVQARVAPSGSESETDAGSKRSAGTPVASDAPLQQAELKQLRIRVVALENVLIALLAHASERQLELVRAMAGHISPRPGFTPHRLTLFAAGEIKSLLRRAETFRSDNKDAR